MMLTIRIGSGAGYSGDRIEPALELAEKGGIQYLVFECLGERTVALAQQARGQLDLPQPTITRSPDANNSDPALGGAPYTWVQLWTWVWTLPQTWAPKSVTVTAGGVSVTATGSPVSLVFDPGDGGDPVSCPGPGRPWTVRDGNDPPTRGGCGYVYRHVTPRGPLTSTVSIRWSVAWTSNTGAGGTLPELVTQASSSFYVQQIQVVIR